MSTNEMTVNTGMLKETRVFNWRIGDFKDLFQCPELIRAQQFGFKIGAQIGLPTRWDCYLNIEPWKPYPGSKMIGLYISLEEKPATVSQVHASFFVAIKDKDGKPVRHFAASVKNMVIRPVRGFQTVIDSRLPAEELPLVDGALVLEVKFTLWKSTLPVKVDMYLDEILAEYHPRFLEKLANDLDDSERLVGHCENQSFRVITKDGWKFALNRGIVAARIKTGFPGKLLNVQTGRMELSGKTMVVLLKYVNSARLHQDWRDPEVIGELMAAAHTYGLELLKQFLNETLGHICTKESAMKMGLIALRFGMDKAVDDILKFVRDNAKNFQDLMIMKHQKVAGNKEGNGISPMKKRRLM